MWHSLFLIRCQLIIRLFRLSTEHAISTDIIYFHMQCFNQFCLYVKENNQIDWLKSLKMHDELLSLSVLPSVVFAIYWPAQEKSSFFAFCRRTPLVRNNFFHGEKIKITYFTKEFLRESLWRNSETISRRNSARFLHADSENSDQTKNLSKCPADMNLHLTGHKTNSESLRPQYNHRMCGHRGRIMYM